MAKFSELLRAHTTVMLRQASDPTVEDALELQAIEKEIDDWSPAQKQPKYLPFENDAC